MNERTGKHFRTPAQGDGGGRRPDFAAPLSVPVNRVRFAGPEADGGYKRLFSRIYERQIWNNQDPRVPLSGPGSAVESTVQVVRGLDAFIRGNHIASVVDVGCGDLTWIQTCRFFSSSEVQYTGIDIVSSVVEMNRRRFPLKTFREENALLCDFSSADLFILRDIAFHLYLADVVRLFSRLRGKFRYIGITTCDNATNDDNFDRWHFSPRNLHRPPFDIPDQPIERIFEPAFKRSFLFLAHDTFYAAYHPAAQE